MSCLWQIFEIPGFCHKKDIIMVLCYLETKIRYRFLAHMFAWQSRNNDAQMIGES